MRKGDRNITINASHGKGVIEHTTAQRQLSVDSALAITGRKTIYQRRTPRSTSIIIVTLEVIEHGTEHA
jgi:hypothetical protein